MVVPKATLSFGIDSIGLGPTGHPGVQHFREKFAECAQQGDPPVVKGEILWALFVQGHDHSLGPLDGEMASAEYHVIEFQYKGMQAINVLKYFIDQVIRAGRLTVLQDRSPS